MPDNSFLCQLAPSNSPHYQFGQLAPREFLYYKANNISKIQVANSPYFYLVNSFYLWMFTECKCLCNFDIV
jgi:hypothetical protein